MNSRRAIVLVIFASAAVYLIGNDRVALWDRDEPRNAQAARQMFQSGDWVVPRFLDKVRTAKPVFTYWCQASAMHLFGDNTFAARFPSAIATTITLIVLGVLLRRHVDPERAFWTVFVLGTSAIVMAWSAKTSLTDSILLLWITIAQVCLFVILHGRGTWPIVITMSIAIGLAGLTKGPVVLGVLAMTLIAWFVLQYFVQKDLGPKGRADRAALKAIIGILIVTAIVAPWIILVEERAPGFLFTTVSRDVVQRVFEPLEQHFGPPGYYLLAVLGIYFPWSVLLPMTFYIAWRNFRTDSIVRFALAAVIGPWLMLECVQTKLPHYLLPIFPPLAYLTADAIVRGLRREHPDLLSLGLRIAMLIWTFIVIVLSLSPWAALRRFDDLPQIAMLAMTFLGFAYAFTVFLCFLTKNPRPGLLAMGIGMMLTIAVASAFYLPNAQFLRLSVSIADVLRKNGADAASTLPGDVQMIAYKEPSLAFYQGGTIREQSENDFLLTHPPDQWPRFVVIRQDIYDPMPQGIKDQLEVLGTPRGLAYADKGRTWTVYVLRKR